MPGTRPRVLLVRGHHPTVFGLRPYELLDDFDVRVAVTRRPRYSLDGLQLPKVRVRTLRDALPAGGVGDALALAAGDRVIGAHRIYAEQDIVHAEELSLWFTAQAARAKAAAGFRLVVTVWETIPLLDAFRTPHARRFRAATLAAADLFVAATERARDGLLLEGVPAERIVVAHPGVDVDRFAVKAARPPTEHLVISPGRLEWEKGHHDVLRAIAALRKGIVAAPEGVARRVRLLIVGSGPEGERLVRHAGELGIADAVEITSVPYAEMPSLYARASAMALGSLPRSGCTLHPGDIPRCFWEEQFGLVLAEGMAAGLPLVLSSSGAIPEVATDQAAYVAPGDWMGMARALAVGALSRPPGTRAEYPAERVRHYSSASAAERLAAVYERVLA